MCGGFFHNGINQSLILQLSKTISSALFGLNGDVVVVEGCLEAGGDTIGVLAVWIEYSDEGIGSRLV
jgi:hypothetical protein